MGVAYELSSQVSSPIELVCVGFTRTLPHLRCLAACTNNETISIDRRTTSE